MSVLRASQMFDASLDEGNAVLAAFYLKQTLRDLSYDDAGVSSNLEKMEKRFGLPATVNQALTLSEQMPQNDRGHYTVRALTRYLDEKAVPLFLEAGGEISRRTAQHLIHSVYKYGHDTTNNAKGSSMVDQLQAAWTAERIEDNPVEAARTAAVVVSARFSPANPPSILFRAALDAAAEKDGVPSAVSIIEEGIKSSVRDVPLLPVMAEFMRQNIMRHAAATSAKTALGTLQYLAHFNRYHQNNSLVDRDLAMSAQTLFTGMPAKKALHLLRPQGIREGYIGEFGLMLDAVHAGALAGYVEAVGSGRMSCEKGLERIKKTISHAHLGQLRTQSVNAYVAVLGAAPQRERAIEAVIQHLGANEFNQQELCQVATSALGLLSTCQPMPDAEKNTKLLQKLGGYLHRENYEASSLLTSSLTTTLNRLAQQNPLGAVQAAMRMGDYSFGRGMYSADGAAADIVSAAVPMLAEKIGPTQALMALLDIRPIPATSFSPQPAVYGAFHHALQSLEKKVFSPPAIA